MKKEACHRVQHVKISRNWSSSFVGRLCACLKNQMFERQWKMCSTGLNACNLAEAQWQIGYGVGLRIKRSSVRIRPWPLRWVLGQGSLLPLSQGEAFTLASISYLAILVKYILAKKKKKKKTWDTGVSVHESAIVVMANMANTGKTVQVARWSSRKRRVVQAPAEPATGEMIFPGPPFPPKVPPPPMGKGQFFPPLPQKMPILFHSGNKRQFKLCSKSVSNYPNQLVEADKLFKKSHIFAWFHCISCLLSGDHFSKQWCTSCCVCDFLF